MKLTNCIGWAKSRPFKFAASLAALALTASAAHAQNFGYYQTDFENGPGHTDTFNNAPVVAPYNSPASTNTDPLSGQGGAGANAWFSNDQTPTVNSVSGQQVGQSDFVGANGGNFGGTQFGALGGIYRDTRFTAAGGNGDVIPSTASGGIISANHTLPAISPSFSTLAFNVDFTINKQNVVNNTNDSFSFRLGTGTTDLLSINFTPSTTAGNVGGRPTGPGVSADIGATIGGNQLGVGGTAGTTTNSVLFLNAQYHLTVTVTTGANPTFQAIFTPQGGLTQFSFNGSLAGATTTPNQITQVGALWNLTDKTTLTAAANGAAAGYANAGSNYIAFDNLQVTVPEPSTYAMMVLGFVGLGLVIRARRQQA